MSTKFRLAIVSEVAGPWSVGGREMVLAGKVPEIAALGVDVTVYTMKWWATAPEVLHRGDGSVRYEAICGGKPSPGPRGRSILQTLRFSLSCISLLWRDFDVVESDPVPIFHLPVLWVVCRIRRKPLVIVWHEFWGIDYWKRFTKVGGRLGAFLEKSFLRFGTRHIAVSRMTHRLLLEAGAPSHRLQLAENVVPEVGGAVRMGADDLVFVGRLVEHKKPMVAVEVLSQLPDKSLRLCVVGKGELKDELIALVRRLNLDHRVSFLADLTDDELGMVLRNARVVLSPSEREGFGLVAAESLSVGTPVVTVDAVTNAAKEFIVSDKMGRVCRTGYLDEIVHAVTEILDSSPTREEVIVDFATLNIPRSYAEVAQKYATVYQSCRK